jgi:hypothetical protein
MKAQKIDHHTDENVFYNVDIKGLSQMALTTENCMRLCSPTSITAVIRFLSSSNDLLPVTFASQVLDTHFDIYGNWILNVAQASHELQDNWDCYVVRLTSFNQIIHQLSKGYPVVVSIQGDLPGSCLPYQAGHLLVVKGYDSKNKEVICMDPAFPKNELTLIRYPFAHFLAAWQRRFGLAYIFEPIKR